MSKVTIGMFFTRYLKSITPPYNSKNLFNLAVTLLILLSIPVTVSLVQKQTRLGSKAAVPTPFFNPSSIWNKPIPANPPLMSGSGSMISQLGGIPIDLIGINYDGGVPVAYATNSDPLVTVRGLTFHLPNDAYPDRGSDGKLLVIDGNYGYSFYRFNRDSLTAEAGGSGDLSTSGDGLTVNGWGGRATGWLYAAGLLMKSEVQAGSVNHALAVSLPQRLVATYPIWPAEASDGAGGSFPEGARLQLDPSLDLNSLGLSSGAKAIARAMQTYGIWISDVNTWGSNSGGYLGFYVEEFTDSSGNPDSGPWSGILSSGDLNGIPISSFRVLAAANQNDFYPIYSGPTPTPTSAIGNNCGAMQQNSAVRGCSNYVEWAGVSQPSASACSDYCTSNRANACEWDSVNSTCYVEFGSGCYVQSGFAGWWAAVCTTATPTPTFTPTPTPTLIPTPTTISGNVLSNSGFETTVSPWVGWQSTITRVSGGHSGSYAAKVAFAGGTTAAYSIGNGPPGEITAVAGANYSASVWVKGVVGRQARLVIRETSAGAESESPGALVTFNGAWQQLASSRTGVNTGWGIDIYVVQSGAVSGDSFLADDFYLAQGSLPSPTSTPTPIPTTAATPTPTPSVSQYGSISGTVYSSRGGVIWGATVSIKVNGTTRSYSTNSSGGYSIPNIPSGTYSVKYSKSGYVVQTLNIAVTANQNTLRNVTLQSKR